MFVTFHIFSRFFSWFQHDNARTPILIRIWGTEWWNQVTCTQLPLRHNISIPKVLPFSLHNFCWDSDFPCTSVAHFLKPYSAAGSLRSKGCKLAHPTCQAPTWSILGYLIIEQRTNRRTSHFIVGLSSASVCLSGRCRAREDGDAAGVRPCFVINKVIWSCLRSRRHLLSEAFDFHTDDEIILEPPLVFVPDSLLFHSCALRGWHFKDFWNTSRIL